MTRKFNPYLNKDIMKARQNVRLAQSNLRRTIRMVQYSCNHDFIVHQDWNPGKWLGPSPAFRICLECGYEEHTAYGNWPGNITKGSCSMETDYSKKTKLNSKFYQKVTDICKYRI